MKSQKRKSDYIGYYIYVYAVRLYDFLPSWMSWSVEWIMNLTWDNYYEITKDG